MDFDKTICCLFLVVRSSIILVGFNVPANAQLYWNILNYWSPNPFVRSFIEAREVAPSVPKSYRLDTWSEYDNPEEGNYIEGDIKDDPYTRRTLVRNEDRLWPDGVLPFFVHRSIAKHKDKVTLLKQAMRYISNITCVRFYRLFPNSKGELPSYPWVFITAKERGCWSHVGRLKLPHRNVLNLSLHGCFKALGHIIHELLHTLGVEHEHMRPDRDKYIEIVLENVHADHKRNFKLLSSKNVTTHGLPYDYGSVMHYSKNAFSIHKDQPTIIPLDPNAEEMGQRARMSRYDIEKLRISYKCDSVKAEHGIDNLNTTDSSDVSSESSTDSMKLEARRGQNNPRPYKKSNYQLHLQTIPYYEMYFQEDQNPSIPDYDKYSYYQ